MAHQPDTLVDRTHRLLESSPRSLGEVSAATGLSKSWLSWFRRTKPADAGAGKVEALLRYLMADLPDAAPAARCHTEPG